MIAAGLAAWGFVESPPGGVSWVEFARDPALFGVKVAYLLREYGLPFLKAFVAMSLFQCFTRVRPSFGLILLMAIIAWDLLLSVLSGGGQMGKPSYVLGMALALALWPQVYAVTQRKVGRFVIPWVIWRGNKKAVQDFNVKMKALAFERGKAA